MKNSKVARQKENDGQILLKIGFLGPKDKLRMRIKKRSKLFEEFRN